MKNVLYTIVLLSSFVSIACTADFSGEWTGMAEIKTNCPFGGSPLAITGKVTIKQTDSEFYIQDCWKFSNDRLSLEVDQCVDTILKVKNNTELWFRVNSEDQILVGAIDGREIHVQVSFGLEATEAKIRLNNDGTLNFLRNDTMNCFYNRSSVNFSKN